MSISIPMWTLPVALVVLATYFMATDKGTGGYFNFPTERGVGGCLLVLLTLAATVGFLIARYAR